MGNPTSYLGKTLTWDGKQLKKAEFGSGTSYYYYEYKYDENGLRTRKTLTVPALSLSETTEYYYNGSVLIGMKIGTGSGAKILRFSYDANGSVVAVDYSTDNGSNYTTYYYLRNAQNDIVKIIDSTGTTVVEYIYDSWGKALSVTGSLTNSLGLDQPFRYRGYVYDTETQWYYLQSRYYDPNTCRFISADVLLSTGQGVLGHNSFAYCGNNPIVRIDSNGQFWLTAIIVTAVVLAVGLTATGCSNQASVGSAPEYTEFEQSDGDRSKNPNCYSYALGLYDRSYDPGELSSTEIDAYTVDAVAICVESDLKALGRGCRRISSYNSPIKDNEYRIALRVSRPVLYYDIYGQPKIDWDYHFMVQTNTGKWAEKHGPAGSSIIHDSGNPSTLSWDCGFIKGYYTSEIIYFAITN